MAGTGGERDGDVPSARWDGYGGGRGRLVRATRARLPPLGRNGRAPRAWRRSRRHPHGSGRGGQAQGRGDAGQRISRVATVISSSSAMVMSRARSFMACLRCRAVRYCARPARSCAGVLRGRRVARRRPVPPVPSRPFRIVASRAVARHGRRGGPGCPVRSAGGVGTVSPVRPVRPVRPVKAEPPRKGEIVFPAVVTGDEAAQRTGKTPGHHAAGTDGAGKGHGMVLRGVAMQRAVLAPPAW